MKIGLILATLFALCTAGFAYTVVVNFSGTIASSSVPGVTAGDPFSGSFTYETTGTNFGGGPASINYGFFLPQDGVVIKADGFTFGGASYLNMNIVDPPFNSILDQSVDYLSVSSDGVFGSLHTNYPGLRLDATAAQFGVNPILLPSNAIPNPFNLADIVIPGNSSDPARALVQLDNGSADFTLLGNITAAEVVPAPEPPATFAMFGTLLGCSVLLRRVARAITRRRAA